MTKTNLDRIVLVIFLVMSVLLFYSTDNYTGIAQKTSANYVRFLSMSIGILCAGQLIYSIFTSREAEKFKLTDNLFPFFGLLIALVCFGFVFETLGFFIPAAVFIPLMAVMLGYRKPLTIFLTTIGVLAFVYLVFIKLLSVNLPGFIS